MKKAFAIAITTMGLIGAALAAPFTPGDLVVYRAGDGAAALGSAATAVFLDEYDISGALVQSVPMPTAVSGSNKRLTCSGSSTSEGLMTLSADGQFLMVTGYDADVGTAAVAGTTAAATNRVVGRVNAAANIDTTTALTDAFSGGTANIRGACSTNGTDIWAAGTGSNSIC